MLTLMRFNIFLIFLFIFTYLIINIYLNYKNNNKLIVSNLINMGFFFSFLFVLSLTIFPASVDNLSNIRYNIIPFKTIYSFLMNKNLIESTFNILGNILLFIPLGFFSYIRLKGNIKKSFLICFYVTALAELTQLFLPMRLSDIDDIILNSMGGIVGIFVAYTLVFNILKINFNKLSNKI